MSSNFVAKRRVEFRDTDAARIMHFSAYVTYMESAEHEFLRSLGLSVMPSEFNSSEHVSWPRVSVNCDYQKPIRFEDEFEIQVSISRLGGKSVTYEFHFQKDGEPIAKGNITAVCCRISEGKLDAIAIPESYVALLSPFVKE